MQQSSQYGSEAEKEEALWRTLIFDSTIPYGFGTPDESYAELYKAHLQHVDIELTIHNLLPESDIEELRKKSDLYIDQSQMFTALMSAFMPGRQFCSTQSGYIGWVPAWAKLGDRVCIFQGYPIPFLVRPNLDKGSEDFELLADAYIHGWMNGDIYDERAMPPRMIRLV
jgi:hypothetical protein